VNRLAITIDPAAHELRPRLQAETSQTVRRIMLEQQQVADAATELATAARHELLRRRLRSEEAHAP
jgi:hypothetical protein